MMPHPYVPDGGVELYGVEVLVLDEDESGVIINGEAGLLGSCAGRLHDHHCARLYCHAGTVRCSFVGGELLTQKFFARTIQLPAMCLKGLGIFAPSVYGPKQIATPTPIVNVGET